MVVRSFSFSSCAFPGNKYCPEMVASQDVDFQGITITHSLEIDTTIPRESNFSLGMDNTFPGDVCNSREWSQQIVNTTTGRTF
jgi:hypothetical protein